MMSKWILYSSSRTDVTASTVRWRLCCRLLKKGNTQFRMNFGISLGAQNKSYRLVLECGLSALKLKPIN